MFSDAEDEPAHPVHIPPVSVSPVDFYGSVDNDPTRSEADTTQDVHSSASPTRQQLHTRSASSVSGLSVHDRGRPLAAQEAASVPLLPLSPDGRPKATNPETEAVIDPSVEKDTGVPALELHRRQYVLYMTILYAVLVVVEWTLQYVLAQRPVVGHLYHEDWPYLQTLPTLMDLRPGYAQNAQWLRVTNVLMAIANVLILPLTSAVCASSAVTYVHHRGKRARLSRGQISTLADEGWTSPEVYLALLRPSGWKIRSSSFLLFAVALSALETVKAPSMSSPSQLYVTDIDSLFQHTNAIDDPTRLARLRSALTSTSNADYQPLIWLEGSSNCNTLTLGNSKPPPICQTSGPTFDDISALPRPYLAQLPANFSTGVTTQFVPRLNSSACMVDDSAWVSKQSRKDLTELMYLNLTATRGQNLVTDTNNDMHLAPTVHRVTVKSTLGLFELPNYKNQGVAGPLVADTEGLCDSACPIGISLDLPDPDTVNGNEQARFDFDAGDAAVEYTSFASTSPQRNGPLRAVAKALFGPGSFIQDRFSDAGVINGDVDDSDYPNPPQTFDTDSCIELVPLAQLMLPTTFVSEGDAGPLVDRLPCIDNVESGRMPFVEATDWLSLFYQNGAMQNSLHAAVILASQLWMTGPSSTVPGQPVLYDPGVDTPKPQMSQAAMIIISLLIGIDLCLLLALATYTSFSYTWTSSFDSFAMMRIGAANAEDLPLLLGDGERTMRVLGALRGWVGDAEPDAEVGRLEVGAAAPLRPRRKYQAFPDEGQVKAGEIDD
ncbi:MAG: hypothetical protein M1838_003200 [Thelocarpon superellum]|nr:MAG: hypothetical protein M1838_003200 [Thelocarpon superellum]